MEENSRIHCKTERAAPSRKVAQDMHRTPKVIEDIAELCLSQDDNASLRNNCICTPSPLCDNHKKMEPNLGRPVEKDSREHDVVCNDHPVEGEFPYQDQAAKTKSLVLAPFDQGNLDDSPQPWPDDNVGKTTEATTKGKGAGADDGKQAPKIVEEVAELCLPRDDNSPLQDDIIGEEEGSSMPKNLLSQKDGFMPQSLREFEDVDNCSMHLHAMSLACKEMMYKDDEEEVSQPKSLSSKDEEVQCPVHDMICFQPCQHVRKRSTENTSKFQQMTKACYIRQFVRLNTERLSNYERFEDLKRDVSNLQTDVVSLKTDNYELKLKISQLQDDNCEFKRENFQLKAEISKLKQARG